MTIQQLFQDLFQQKFKKLQNYFINEIDNYVLWLPIFFIIGIIGQFYLKYFNYKILISFLIFILCYFVNKKYYYLRLINIIIIFILCGYIRTYYFVKHHTYNTINYPLGFVKVYGKIEKEIINKTSKGSYNKEIIVKVDKIKQIKTNKYLENIPKKLKIRLKNLDTKVYLSDVILTTVIFPLQDKYFESDFNFKEYMSFKEIGGIGYKGEIIFNKQTEKNLSFKQKIDILRNNIAQKIIQTRKAESTSIIAVLLTGQKNLADKQAMEYMNYSGLAHLLSISGLHMMTLIGLSIIIIKWLLLRTEYFALNYNIFKISATISLIINFVYLLLSGSSISAIRAYIMSVILLISIIIGRFNTSLRSVMFVMFIILLIKPYSIFDAGFQMSFMAVIGLISIIEYYYSYKYNKDQTLTNKHFSGNISQYFILGFITSLVAECATTPFSIYNFNNYSFYNIFANSFLTPLVSFIVLPLGLISMFLYIFNLEWITIIPASYVMDLVLYVSKFITEIPHSVMFVRSPNLLSMFLMIFGFLWFCLWKEKWRHFGIVLYLVGLLILPFQKEFDIVIDHTDKMVIMVDKDKLYVYNPNKYKMKKILRKFGKTKYVNINTNIKQCNKNYCTTIINKNNIIIFIKDNKLITINKDNLTTRDNFEMKIQNVYANEVIQNY
ncbi:MAG: ComEC/Rec2 family competence protein [Rickettsiales bacterium]|nr:ComEC/Rec2 family competence protein [Rickettsiales bacterium]